MNTFRWAIDLLDGASGLIVKALGILSPTGHGVAHSTEELQIQIQQARERGLLAVGEEKFIRSAIELSQLQVREIMVSRPDMHTLPIEATMDEVLSMFATTQRSRIPVYRESVDHVLGFVHIKDMMWVLLDHERRIEEKLPPPPPFDLRRVLREILIVPETKPASELLVELRSRHVGMAMVVDEFGSILGLVTLEDLLEQLVGEIHDEFDVVEKPLTLADGAVIFDGALNVRDLDNQYNIALPEDPAYATVGGFVMDQLGFIPRGGEGFEYGDYRFTVIEMDGRRVARVKIQLLRPKEPETSTGESAGASPAVSVYKPLNSSGRRELSGGYGALSAPSICSYTAGHLAGADNGFFLIHIVPGDPVEQMLGEGAAPGQAAQLRHSLGLDRPLYVQYGRYLAGCCSGRSGAVVQISSAGAKRDFRALSRHAAVGVFGASCLCGHRHSCRRDCSAPPRLE